MDTTCTLALASALVLSYCGVGGALHNLERTEDFMGSYSRIDAEQEPFTSVTLVPEAAGPQSTLFGSCIAESLPLDARFLSIETESGSEFIRYVPDFSWSFPVPWTSITEGVSNIFDCTEAAAAGGWSMFKYDGNVCKVAREVYNLQVDPNCSDQETDAVFISSSANPTCKLPNFVPSASKSSEICLLRSETLMSFEDARSFCSSNGGMILFDNGALKRTLIIPDLKNYGFTQTNLWVDCAKVSGSWPSQFRASDWVDGAEPSDVTAEVAYLDSQAEFNLRGTTKTALAGVLCITSP